MHSIPVDLSFTDANRCHRVLHAVMDGRGWHVRALLAGRVFTRDCSDWQHVERTRGWLQAHSHLPAAEALEWRGKFRADGKLSGMRPVLKTRNAAVPAPAQWHEGCPCDAQREPRS